MKAMKFAIRYRDTGCHVDPSAVEAIQAAEAASLGFGP